MRIFLNELPGVIISSLVQLQEGVVYGLLFFPVSFGQYQAIGITLFFASCFVSQFAIAASSGFVCGIPQPIIELIPFNVAIARSVLDGCGGKVEAALPTVLMCMAICGVLHGTSCFLLGYFRFSNFVE